MGCGTPDTQAQWLAKTSNGKWYELLCVATNADGLPALQIRATYEGGFYNVYSEDGTDYLYCVTIEASDKDLAERGYSKVRKDMPTNPSATQPFDAGLVQGRTLDEWLDIGYQNSFLPHSDHIHPELFEDEALERALINSLSVVEVLEYMAMASEGQQSGMHTDQPMLPGFEGKGQEFDTDNMLLAGLRDAPTTDVDPFLPTDEDDDELGGAAV